MYSSKGGSPKMKVEMKAIGYIRTGSKEIPRHWTVSDVEGTLDIHREYLEGLKDIKPGQRIVVIFYFHESPEFDPQFLVQTPPHRNEKLGVFSICSPKRPNPIGMSVYNVLAVEGNVIRVKGVDAFDGTPILDIKPFVTEASNCPSSE
jgi:tRNA-Thr(GGU) m(6)t(6)A37 methyltransferase TsaA